MEMKIKQFGLCCTVGLCFIGSMMGCGYGAPLFHMDNENGSQPNLEELEKLRHDVENKADWAGVIASEEQGNGFLVEDSRGCLRHLKKRARLLSGMLQRPELFSERRAWMREKLEQCAAAVAIINRMSSQNRGESGVACINMRYCEHCKVLEVDKGRKLLKCVKCRNAYYCDEDCQRSDWARHKSVCCPDRSRTRTIVVYGEDARILQEAVS